MLRGGHRLERPDNCPEELYNLMTKCWELNAENRPSFSTLLEQIEQLQSKAERNLASSIYQLEDYVTMTTQVETKTDAVTMISKKITQQLSAISNDCCFDDDSSNLDSCTPIQKYSIRTRATNNYTKLAPSDDEYFEGYCTGGSNATPNPASIVSDDSVLVKSPALV